MWGGVYQPRFSTGRNQSHSANEIPMLFVSSYTPRPARRLRLHKTFVSPSPPASSKV